VKPEKKSPGRILELLQGDGAEDKVAAEIGESAAAVGEARELLASTDAADAPAIAGLPVALAEAVLEAAARAKKVDLIRAVLSEGSKDIARAAKRALHVLRSQGVDLGPEPTPAASSPKPVAAAETVLTCLASPIDGAGQKVVWIARPQRFGGVQVILAVLSDVEGVVDSQIGEMSRKGFREYVRRAGDISPGLAPRDIPAEKAKAFIAAALAIQHPKGDGPAHLDVLQGIGGDAILAVPQAASEPAFSDAEETRLSSESGSLHDEAEIAGWFPEEETLRQVALKVEELGTSKIVVDEAQRKQQLQHIIDRFGEEYFTPERRKRYANRLFEMADHFRTTGREEAARRASATARSLNRGEPDAGRGFMRRMFDKLVPHLLAASTEKPAEEPKSGGLIVTP
jgi:hypothetical protein